MCLKIPSELTMFFVLPRNWNRRRMTTPLLKIQIKLVLTTSVQQTMKPMEACLLMVKRQLCRSSWRKSNEWVRCIIDIFWTILVLNKSLWTSFVISLWLGSPNHFYIVIWYEQILSDNLLEWGVPSFSMFIQLRITFIIYVFLAMFIPYNILKFNFLSVQYMSAFVFSFCRFHVPSLFL